MYTLTREVECNFGQFKNSKYLPKIRILFGSVSPVWSTAQGSELPLAHTPRFAALVVSRNSPHSISCQVQNSESRKFLPSFLHSPTRKLLKLSSIFKPQGKAEWFLLLMLWCFLFSSKFWVFDYVIGLKPVNESNPFRVIKCHLTVWPGMSQ